MKEIEKRKISKDGKVFTAFVVESVRDAVDTVHENQIPREDLITILREEEGYVVFCYR